MHISKVISKISKIMYMLKRVSKFLNTKSLILLYNSLILPHFIFSIEIWGTTFKYNINKLFYLQKKAIRIINKNIYKKEKGITKLTNTNIFYKNNNILKINDLIEYRTLIFMHKMCHGSMHNRVKEMFNLCSVGRNATSKLIKQASHRTKKRSRHPVIYGTSLWNALQNSIRKYGEISFKRILRKVIISKY